MVSAYDIGGNESPKSIAIAVTTPPDTTAPTVPQNLTAVLAAPYQINLAWAPSTDNDLVAGYKVFRNGALYMYTASTSFADTGGSIPLTPSTSYTYTVSAYDRSGNSSALSNSVSMTTGP